MDVLDLVNDNNQVGIGHDAHARPHVCEWEQCDKAFARKSDLARHCRIHTNDRPFTCTYRNCGKAFIQRSALTVHFRTHTGEKPHGCETCGKPFADSSSLARHRRIHTGLRPYACPVRDCLKPFARRNTLLKHFKRHHPTLAPPSTSSNRPSIHGPVGMRTSSGSFLSASPSGELYFSSPTSGLPHGFAPFHPSEGTASNLSGGFHGSILGGGAGVYSGVTFRPGYGHSPQTQGSLSLTPISTSSSHLEPYHHGSETPSTPGSGLPGSDFQYQQRSGSGTGSTLYGVSPSPIEEKPDFDFSQQVSPLAGYPHSPNHPLSRFPSEGGGVMYSEVRPMVSTQRSSSNPLDAPRFQSYTVGPYGHVGGGFHPSQLAMPQSQVNLVPSYHHSMASAMNAVIERKPDLSPSPETDTEDEDDGPLISVQENPTFTLHPPNGPVMTVPFSAVEPSHHGHLSSGQPQFVVNNLSVNRLQSAPPTMQRFNSLPVVPSMNHSWPSALQFPVLAAGNDQSSEQDWQEIADKMISREGSASMTEDTLVSGLHVEKIETSPGSDAGDHWGAPIDFPIPPRNGQRNPFSSNASSSFTGSTLIASVDSLTPLSIQPQYAQSMVLTPVQPNGFFPSPISPAGSQGWLHGQLKPQFIIDSAAQLVHHSTHDQENRPAQDVTLTTPPRWDGRKDSRSVSSVGLGLANVHFSSCKQDIPPEQEYLDVEQGWQEGDEELKSGDEDDEACEEDDEEMEGSDDEYVPEAMKRTGGRRIDQASTVRS
ncbi:hypothetical protein IAU60_006449 [Kwoniella sp. DSM 27419]